MLHPFTPEVFPQTAQLLTDLTSLRRDFGNPSKDLFVLPKNVREISPQSLTVGLWTGDLLHVSNKPYFVMLYLAAHT